jgi:filamentous hemagglutinin family protein
MSITPHQPLTSVTTALLVFGTLLQAASSVPSGGTFVAGSGHISTSGNTLVINQNTLKGIIDWNTFSLGQGTAVRFKNGAGPTLNRVTGALPSTILGQLSATGSIFLLKPQGILIGHGAIVHTGGDFLASTLNLPDQLFLANSLIMLGNSNTTVINLGTVTSDGGNVYLIGHSVQNVDNINAPNGTIGLAAGSEVMIIATLLPIKRSRSWPLAATSPAPAFSNPLRPN